MLAALFPCSFWTTQLWGGNHHSVQMEILRFSNVKALVQGHKLGNDRMEISVQSLSGKYTRILKIAKMSHYLTGTVVLFHFPVFLQISEPTLKHHFPSLPQISPHYNSLPCCPDGSKSLRKKAEAFRVGQKHKAHAWKFPQQVPKTSLWKGKL